MKRDRYFAEHLILQDGHVVGNISIINENIVGDSSIRFEDENIVQNNERNDNINKDNINNDNIDNDIKNDDTTNYDNVLNSNINNINISNNTINSLTSSSNTNNTNDNDGVNGINGGVLETTADQTLAPQIAPTFRQVAALVVPIIVTQPDAPVPATIANLWLLSNLGKTMTVVDDSDNDSGDNNNDIASGDSSNN